MSSDFKDTEFLEYDRESIKLETFGTVIRGVCPDNNVISLNCNEFGLSASRCPIERVIIDRTDMKYANPRDPESVKTLKAFMQNHPQRRIYIRKISRTSDWGEEHFFKDEVLAIIRAVLRQQDISIEDPDKLVKYRKMWRVEGPHLCRMINKAELKSIMDDFNIDKRRITIVPDLDDIRKESIWLENQDNAIMSHVNYFGFAYMYVKEAMFMTLRTIVCKVNWNVDTCGKHLNCEEECVATLFEVLTRLEEMDRLGTVMIEANYILRWIRELEATCYMQHQRELFKKDFLSPFSDLKNTDSISIAQYHEIVNEHGLVKVLVQSSKGKDHPRIPVWLARVLCIVGRFKQFTNLARMDEEFLENIQRAAHDGLMYIIPKKHRGLFLGLLTKDDKLVIDFDDEELEVDSTHYEKVLKAAEQRMKKIQQKKLLKKSKNGSKNEASQVEQDATFICSDTGKRFFLSDPGVDVVKTEEKFTNSVMEILTQQTPFIGENEGELIYGDDIYTLNYFEFPTKQRNSNHFKKVFAFNKLTTRAFLEGKKLSGIKCEESREYLKCPESYAKIIMKNNFVIRALIDIGLHEGHSPFVFCDEIREVVPLLLASQGKPQPIWKERLDLQLELASSNILHVNELHKLLELFGVDRSAITIIHDPASRMAIFKAIEDIETPITTIDTNGDEMMSARQAVLHIFINLVCGIDWTLVSDDKFKQLLMYTIDEYTALQNTHMVGKADVDKEIKLFRKVKYSSGHSNYFLQDRCFSDEVPLADYHDICKTYHLMIFAFNVEHIPVWKARFYLLVGWITSFYKDEDVQYNNHKKILMDSLYTKIPLRERDGMTPFTTSVKTAWSKASAKRMATGYEPKSTTYPPFKVTFAEVLKSMNKKKKAKKNKPKSEMPKGENDEEEPTSTLETKHAEQEDEHEGTNTEASSDTEESVSNQHEEIEANNGSQGEIQREIETPDTSETGSTYEPNGTSKSDDPTMPKKALTRCDQWEEHLPYMKLLKTKLLNAGAETSQAKKDRKEAKERADKFENRAKRTEGVEKKMRDMEKELEKLKLRNVRIQEERKEEKERMEKLEEKEKKRKNDEKMLREQLRSEKQVNDALRAEVARLQEEADKLEPLEAEKKCLNRKLKTLNESSSNLEIENRRLQQEVYDNQIVSGVKISELDTALAEKKKENNELAVVNSQQVAEINELKERNSSLQQWMNNFAAGTSSDEKMTVQEKLAQLREMKINFPATKEERKKEMLLHNDRLLALNNDEKTRKIVAYEYIHFEKSSRIFMETLDLNIEKIGRTNSIAFLFPLKYPSISSESRIAYDAELRKTGQTGVPDTDCGICYHVRKSNEDVKKCDDCPRIFHKVCINKWLKEEISERECPFCRQQQELDREEFPMMPSTSQQ